MSKKLGLPLDHNDVLRIVRKGKECGMTYSDLAKALRIPLYRLHVFMLRHGAFEDAKETVSELRRVPA